MNNLPVFSGYPNRQLSLTFMLVLGSLLIELTGCATTPTPTGSTVLQTANDTLATASPAAQLINQLRVIVPSSPRLCDSKTPWQGGVFQLPNQGLLNPGECFGIELNLLKKSDVFLFNEDAEGRWQYLPAGGTGYSYDHLSVNVGEWLQFPPHHVFDVGSHEEQVHVFAVDGTEAVNAMNQLLREQSVCCNPQQIFLTNPKEKLLAFSRQFNTASEWRSLSVRAAHMPLFRPVTP